MAQFFGGAGARRSALRQIPRAHGQDADPVMIWLAASPQPSWQVAPERQGREELPGHCNRHLDPVLQVAFPPAPKLTVQLAPDSHSTWAASPAASEQLLFPWHS